MTVPNGDWPHTSSFVRIGATGDSGNDHGDTMLGDPQPRARRTIGGVDAGEAECVWSQIARRRRHACDGQRIGSSSRRLSAPEVNVETPSLAAARGGALVARRRGPYDRSVTSGDGPLPVDRAGCDAVLGALERRGYTLVGPTLRDRAIVLEEVDSTAELPAGWTVVHDEVCREFPARLGKPAAGRRAGPNAGRAPSP